MYSENMSITFRINNVHQRKVTPMRTVASERRKKERRKYGTVNELIAIVHLFIGAGMWKRDFWMKIGTGKSM
jgi:hypothetical protein